MPSPGRPPGAFYWSCRRLGIAPTRDVLVVSVLSQCVRWYVRTADLAPVGRSPSRAIESPDPGTGIGPVSPSIALTRHELQRTFRASTSRFGIGQIRDSHRTPLGLHRIACKVGAGWPIGTVFRARQPIGYTWRGLPSATLAHRILWLDGLEPGFNRGGEVDTFRRFIYIHGLADEPTLGRPASHGCVHLSAADLMPLFDRIPSGTLVWITTEP